MRNRFSLIRIVAVALLLYSLWSLYNSYSGIRNAERTALETENTLAGLINENTELKRKIEQAENGEMLEMLVRQRLGYIKPGERVFLFPDTED